MTEKTAPAGSDPWVVAELNSLRRRVHDLANRLDAVLADRLAQLMTRLQLSETAITDLRARIAVLDLHVDQLRISWARARGALAVASAFGAIAGGIVVTLFNKYVL